MSEFDNFYWKHNDCLNKDTSLAHSFGEKVWNHQQAKIDRLTLEIAEMKSRLNDNYTSGQTSMYLTKQAKIDLLEVQLKGAEERAKLTLDHKNKMVDELQSRVDEALERMDAESSNSWGLWKEKADMYEQGASDAYEKSYWILKGNKYEK